MQYQAKAIATISDAAGYTHLRFERPREYNFVPGQYATLASEGDPKPRFLALASHPTESELLFVARQVFQDEALWTFSAPQGAGFAADFHDVRPFLFLTHGTGVSAIRPALIERQKLGRAADTLLYGVADAAAEPDLDCLRPAMPVRQLRAYSRSEAPQHVQNVLQTLELAPYAAIIIIGSQDMMQTCREIIAEKHFDPARVFSNY